MIGSQDLQTQHRCFLVAEFSRAPIFKNICVRLLLTLASDSLELCFWTVTFKTTLAKIQVAFKPEI